VGLLVVPVVALSVLEGALWLSGYGHPTTFFVRAEVGGEGVWVDNPEFGRRIFPPGLERYPWTQVIPREKGPGVMRIVVFGESAAMGDPDPRFGLPRMLEELLRQRFPAGRVEVVNASMVAINSHVVLPIARECAARLDADLWVIYMGNNEMVGPYGSLSVFGRQAPGLRLIRWSLALRRTRVGQALAALIHRVRSAGQPPAEWGGMSMMAEQRIRQSDMRTQRVYAHFEQNLKDLLAAGRQAGVPMIVCSVATNLKDCPPFASLNRVGLSESDRERWQARYDEGIALEGEGALAAAGEAYEQAAAIDDDHAELCFRRARLAFRNGENARALELFRRARDQDALQFRTDSELNDTIREVARAWSDRNVHFLDFEEQLSSVEEVPGNEFFLEHVHFKPEGNHVLALAVAEKAVEVLGWGAATRNVKDEREWAASEECLSALGFTEWNRWEILDEILDRMEQPPFTQQLDHARRIEELRGRVNALRSASKPVQLERAVRQVAEAVGRRPKDADLRWNLAQLLELAGHASAAEDQWRAVIALQPHAHLAYYNLAKLLDVQGRTAEAREMYAACLERKRDYEPAKRQLAPGR
jgi:tetratricopeptide (TPR) repeat protein